MTQKARSNLMNRRLRRSNSDFVIFSGKKSKFSREERLVLCIGDIIKELITAQEESKDVQLNRLKTRLASKYGLETSPRLVDIIAAVPHDYKKTLLPKLKAKPVRTASGVSLSNLSYIRDFINEINNNMIRHWISLDVLKNINFLRIFHSISKSIICKQFQILVQLEQRQCK